MTDAEYMAAQAAFLDGHGASLLVRCGRLVSDGLLPSDWSVRFPQQRWAFPPALLPVMNVRWNLVYAAWISDPVNVSLDVISLINDAPMLSGASYGKTGLRVLAKMIDVLGSDAELDDDDSALCAFVDAFFSAATPGQRAELVRVARVGFEPRSEGDVRGLPLVGDLWTPDEGVRSYGEPLRTIFARNARPTEHAPPPEQRPAFDAALSRDDVLGAWARLNDSGWTYEDCIRAFDSLAPRLDPSVVALVRRKLAPDNFGPISGY